MTSHFKAMSKRYWVFSENQLINGLNAWLNRIHLDPMKPTAPDAIITQFLSSPEAEAAKMVAHVPRTETT